MIAMTTVEAREHFSEVINRTAFGKERILLTRRGKSVAVVIPLEDLTLLEAIEDQIDLQDAQKALKEIRNRNLSNLK